MIVDKKAFKELLSEGGGKFKSINSMCKFQFGINEIKFDTPINLYVLNNGVAIDVPLGKKVFIEFDTINQVESNMDKLLIKVDGNDIVVKFTNKHNLEKVYMSIRQYCNMEYKEYNSAIFSSKDIEKENKEREFERIMSSNPEVSHKPSYIFKEPKKPKEVCCPKCGSTSLSANKKGFGLLKGAAGVLTFGAYGVVTAGIGKNKIIVTCLACGKQFKPGK